MEAKKIYVIDNKTVTAWRNRLHQPALTPNLGQEPYSWREQFSDQFHCIRAFQRVLKCRDSLRSLRHAALSSISSSISMSWLSSFHQNKRAPIRRDRYPENWDCVNKNAIPSTSPNSYSRAVLRGPIRFNLRNAKSHRAQLSSWARPTSSPSGPRM